MNRKGQKPLLKTKQAKSLCKGEIIMIYNDVDDELIDASISGDLEKVKECLENGADVNTYSNIDWTPLLCATHFNHLEITKYLIEKGADVNPKDTDTLQLGLTPLLSATTNEIKNDEVKKEIIKLLIDNGADVNAKDRNGYTPLINACIAIKDNFEVVKSLIEKGADVNAKPFKREETALNYAKDKKVISLLKSKMQIKPKAKAKTKQPNTNNFGMEV